MKGKITIGTADGKLQFLKYKKRKFIKDFLWCKKGNLKNIFNV